MNDSPAQAASVPGPGQTEEPDVLTTNPMPRVSIRWDASIAYPGEEDYFSPGDQFPEYKLGHLSGSSNLVYRAVRSCLADAELDASNYGTPAWNPLGAYIKPRDRVFVLCNFVKHNDQAHSPLRFWSKCTHGSVVRAVLDYVLLALQGDGTVRFGNAPIQSCDWSRVLRETGASRVEQFYRTHGGRMPVSSCDLRRHVVRGGLFSGMEVEVHADDEACVPVDIGWDSLLDGFYTHGAKPQLRVLDYDPRRTERCHGEHKHTYILHRAILESDVIISIPKLKTHEKVGMTAGIKGCVGTVAHKDCLAHHRLGSPKALGDEYPDHLCFLRPLSALHDFVNLRAPGLAKRVGHCLDGFLRKIVRRFNRSLGGSWPGNDTCWRMALDMARIVAFADEAGRLQSQTQRRHLVVMDGVIGGEGNGPLSPQPVPFGYVSFSDNVVASDHCSSLAMGFDPEKLPLLRGAMLLDRFPLVTQPAPAWEVRLNGSRVTAEELSGRFTRRFLPPREWREVLNANS